MLSFGRRRGEVVPAGKLVAGFHAHAPRLAFDRTIPSYTLESLPTVLRYGPYRLFFYSTDREEPPHVHVEREEFHAKFWLDPAV